MRIGILSDTHDQVARTAIAVEMLIAQGAELLIHCGDLTGPEVVAVCGRLPCYYVFGNNDFEKDRLRREMARVGGTLPWSRVGDVLVLERAARGDDARRFRLPRRAPPRAPSIPIISCSATRTAAQADDRDGRTRWINPGRASAPRRRTWTVAVLDLAIDDLRLRNLDEK